MTRLLFHLPVRPLPGDRYCTIEYSHAARRTVLLLLRFHTDPRCHPANDPHAGRITLAMYPRIRARPCLDLNYLETARAHLPRQPGVGIIANGGPVIRVAALRSVTGLVLDPPAGLRFRLHRLGLDRLPQRAAVVAPRRPLVDRLGQWKSYSWPGKSSRLGPELPPARPAAEGTLSGHCLPQRPQVEGRVPSGRFHPQRKPVEGFRVARGGGRLWIVTAGGERLFSLGMNCVSARSGGPVAGMERLFERLPPRHGTDVSFYTENLKRRYGAAWPSRWAALATRRLAGWGFNTIGNWSDPAAWSRRRLYYTMNAAWWDDPKTGDDWGLYGGFPDVYSPAFARRCDERARRGTRPDDPLLLGYFILNEPQWQRTDIHLAAAALRTGKAPATRAVLLEWLRRHRGRADARPTAADLDAMRALMVERYFATVCGALRRHDPHHLLLGIRFYGVPPAFLLRPMRHMDVVSVNTYATRPDPGIMRTLHRATGRPVLLGEFHMGAVDRGLTSHGLVGVAGQRERGIAYARYVEQAAAIPYCVGAHWFQHVDQPVLGRFDGENYNIGFVDVTDRPYPELAAAATAANALAPLIHAGRARPRTRAPRLDPTGLSW